MIKEVTEEPKNESDTQSVIPNVLPGSVSMDTSEQKSLMPENKPFSFVSSTGSADTDHDSTGRVPPKHRQMHQMTTPVCCLGNNLHLLSLRMVRSAVCFVKS